MIKISSIVLIQLCIVLYVYAQTDVQWVTNPYQTYPYHEYLIKIGVGSSIEEAHKQAFTTLLRVLYINKEEHYHFLNNISSDKQKNVKEDDSLLLYKYISFSEPYFDGETYKILAFVKRSEMSKQMELQIQKILTQMKLYIHNEVDIQKDLIFSHYQKMSHVLQYAQSAYDIVNQYAIIRLSHNQVAAFYKRIDYNTQYNAYKNAQNRVQFGLYIHDSSQNTIMHDILYSSGVTTLENLGFTVTTEQLANTGVMVYFSNTVIQSDTSVDTHLWDISIDIIDGKNTDIVYVSKAAQGFIDELNTSVLQYKMQGILKKTLYNLLKTMLIVH